MMAFGVTLTPAAGRAQLPFIDVGVKAGLTVADVDSEDTEAIIGYAVGGHLRFPVAPFISLQPEVMFTTKGAQFTVQGVATDIRVSYFEGALLGRLGAPTPGISPSFFAGPAVAVRASTSVSSDDPGIDEDQAATAAEDARKSFDFGVIVGSTLDLGTFFIEARYNLGLLDIDDTGGAAQKNRVISFLLGIEI